MHERKPAQKAEQEESLDINWGNLELVQAKQTIAEQEKTIAEQKQTIVRLLTENQRLRQASVSTPLSALPLANTPSVPAAAIGLSDGLLSSILPMIGRTLSTRQRMILGIAIPLIPKSLLAGAGIDLNLLLAADKSPSGSALPSPLLLKGPSENKLLEKPSSDSDYKNNLFAIADLAFAESFNQQAPNTRFFNGDDASTKQKISSKAVKILNQIETWRKLESYPQVVDAFIDYIEKNSNNNFARSLMHMLDEKLTLNCNTTLKPKTLRSQFVNNFRGWCNLRKPLVDNHEQQQADKLAAQEAKEAEEYEIMHSVLALD